MVQTRLYSITSTFHFPSGPTSLATPASLNSAQEPLLLSSMSPPLRDHPSAACLVQTATATGLPHTHCCHAGHPLLQCHSCPQGSQILVLAVRVRNGMVWVTSQEQGDQWNSAHHAGSWSHIQALGWEGLKQFDHPSIYMYYVYDMYRHVCTNVCTSPFDSFCENSIPCTYIAHTCSCSVCTSSYIVHGYYWLFAYTTKLYARHGLYSPCNMDVLCSNTGISRLVYTGFS